MDDYKHILSVREMMNAVSVAPEYVGVFRIAFGNAVPQITFLQENGKFYMQSEVVPSDQIVYSEKDYDDFFKGFDS